MENQKKLFAFKLAEKQTSSEINGRWKTRDGVAIAGCTIGPTPAGRVPITPFQDSMVEC